MKIVIPEIIVGVKRKNESSSHHHPGGCCDSCNSCGTNHENEEVDLCGFHYWVDEQRESWKQYNKENKIKLGANRPRGRCGFCNAGRAYRFIAIPKKYRHFQNPKYRLVEGKKGYRKGYADRSCGRCWNEVYKQQILRKGWVSLNERYRTIASIRSMNEELELKFNSRKETDPMGSDTYDDSQLPGDELSDQSSEDEPVFVALPVGRELVLKQNDKGKYTWEGDPEIRSVLGGSNIEGNDHPQVPQSPPITEPSTTVPKPRSRLFFMEGAPGRAPDIGENLKCGYCGRTDSNVWFRISSKLFGYRENDSCECCLKCQRDVNVFLSRAEADCVGGIDDKIAKLLKIRKGLIEENQRIDKGNGGSQSEVSGRRKEILALFQDNYYKDQANELLDDLLLESTVLLKRISGDESLKSEFKDLVLKELRISTGLALYLKEKNNITDSQYTAFRVLTRYILPSLYSMGMEKKLQNQNIGIDVKVEKGFVYVDAREKLQMILKKNPSMLDSIKKKKVKKLILQNAIDGFDMTARKSETAASFTISDENFNPIGNDVVDLMFIDGTDKYDNLVKPVPIWENMLYDLEKNGIEIDGEKIEIVNYFVLDMKANLCVLGMPGAMADYFCGFCTIPKLSKNITSSKLKWEYKTLDGHFRYTHSKNKTLLKHFGLDRFLPCSLHCTFRSSEKLLQRLFWVVDVFDTKRKTDLYSNQLDDRLKAIKIKHWRRARSKRNQKYKKIPLNRSECMSLAKNWRSLLIGLEQYSLFDAVRQAYADWAVLCPLFLSDRRLSEQEIGLFHRHKISLCKSMSRLCDRNNYSNYFHYINFHFDYINKTKRFLNNQKQEMKHKMNKITFFRSTPRFGGRKKGFEFTHELMVQRDTRIEYNRNEMEPEYAKLKIGRSKFSCRNCLHYGTPTVKGHWYTTCPKPCSFCCTIRNLNLDSPHYVHDDVAEQDRCTFCQEPTSSGCLKECPTVCSLSFHIEKNETCPWCGIGNGNQVCSPQCSHKMYRRSHHKKKEKKDEPQKEKEEKPAEIFQGMSFFLIGRFPEKQETIKQKIIENGGTVKKSKGGKIPSASKFAIFNADQKKYRKSKSKLLTACRVSDVTILSYTFIQKCIEKKEMVVTNEMFLYRGREKPTLKRKRRNEETRVESRTSIPEVVVVEDEEELLPFVPKRSKNVSNDWMAFFSRDVSESVDNIKLKSKHFESLSISHADAKKIVRWKKKFPIAGMERLVEVGAGYVGEARDIYLLDKLMKMKMKQEESTKQLFFVPDLVIRQFVGTNKKSEKTLIVKTFYEMCFKNQVLEKVEKKLKILFGHRAESNIAGSRQPVRIIGHSCLFQTSISEDRKISCVCFDSSLNEDSLECRLPSPEAKKAVISRKGWGIHFNSFTKMLLCYAFQCQNIGFDPRNLNAGNTIIEMDVKFQGKTGSCVYQSIASGEKLFEKGSPKVGYLDQLINPLEYIKETVDRVGSFLMTEFQTIIPKELRPELNQDNKGAVESSCDVNSPLVL